MEAGAPYAQEPLIYMYTVRVTEKQGFIVSLKVTCMPHIPWPLNHSIH